MARIVAAHPPFPPQVPWTNQDIFLYHGTIDRHQASIMAGVSVSAGRSGTDFGRGYCTTTLLAQARSWAWQLSARNPGSVPVVIRFTVSRDDLTDLESVWFVRGSTNTDDFWSLIHHCRTGGADHVRNGPGWYDVAIGPVAASWRQRLCILDGDQISFHTQDAADLLDRSSKAIVP